MPSAVFNLMRSTVTAWFGPIREFRRNGFMRSAFRMSAVDRGGHMLPWYSYPAIDFLAGREFSGRRVLEFGAGNSSIWWARQVGPDGSVVAFDGNPEWFEMLRTKAPANLELHLVDNSSAAVVIGEVEATLNDRPDDLFDIVVIDGLHRKDLIPLAMSRLAPGGALICDNSEGYGFAEGLRGHGLSRVDFHGMAPGVILPHCTSLCYRGDCFLLSEDYDIVLPSEQAGN